MIRYIKGTLEMIEEDAVILDNQGIGYRILVSPAMMDRLPVMGGEMKLYTYLNVREDAMQLFGFGNVDELEILSIKEGQTVTITADAISDRTFTGVVTSVSAAGTTTGGTTTYPVTIRIDDTGDLLPGMNATAEIEVSSASNALAVPNGSVVRGNYVLDNKDSPSAANAVQDMTAPDGYVYVKITTGTSDNDSIEVTGGLQEGDTIAYDANAAEKQNASDSMEFMVGPGGTIAYDADAAEKQNASGSGGHGGGNGGPGGRGPGGGF